MSNKMKKFQMNEEMADRILGRECQDLDVEDKLLAANLHVETPYSEIRDACQKLIGRSGTDVKKNAQDPYGDGDQTVPPTEVKRQILRELYATAGDIECSLTAHNKSSRLSEFAFLCASGNARAVDTMLKDTNPGSDERQHLLECRETSLRMSPLLLTITLSKRPERVLTLACLRSAELNHLDVVKLLLKYGSRPDPRDVCGKTPCHNGAGAFSSDVSLQCVDYCIDASKSSAHVWQDVIMKNLSSDKYNGQMGTLCGYVSETGRRVVRLHSTGEEICVKPVNIMTRDDGKCILDQNRKLVDETDRTGTVALHEVIMSDRSDVAKFLLDKHQADLDIEDPTGLSPRSMVLGNGMGMNPSVNKVVQRHFVRIQKRENRAATQVCDKCGKQSTNPNEFLECSKCGQAWYCGPECQKTHWKKHKKHCKDMNLGLKLGRPLSDAMGFMSKMSFGPVHAGPAGLTSGGGYKKPKGVSVDERFWIKVQANGVRAPMLIYDQSRSCNFTLSSDTKGFDELLEKVQAERAFMGRKRYFEASFNAEGDCTIFLESGNLKNW